jgi:hypothetical protein
MDDQRRPAAASESLRITGNQTVLRVLVEAAGTGGDWVLATLGRLPSALVRPALKGSDLLTQVAPMLLLPGRQLVGLRESRCRPRLSGEAGSLKRRQAGLFLR